MIIKVCGMRDGENIRAVEGCGIDWMGFIFYPRSPRYVSHRPSYLPTSVHRIGVFVNASTGEIEQKALEYGLWGVQLHGNETPEQCRRLQGLGLKVIKACSIASAADAEKAEVYASQADYLLFDTRCKEHGGSGRTFDWSLLDHYTASTPFLLSGGLQPSLSLELCTFSHPQLAGYDLNSGFETAPALKDAVGIQHFIETIKKKKA